MEGFFEREEDGEPREHVGRDAVGVVRVDGESDVAVEVGLKVACETVEWGGVGDVEGEVGRSGVVRIGQGST